MTHDAVRCDIFFALTFWLRKIGAYLGEVVSSAGKTQLRIAETEKYAHVTYFFNGGIEKPFPGEDRKIVPSPKVATYDLQPEMSAAGGDRRGARAHDQLRPHHSELCQS